MFMQDRNVYLNFSLYAKSYTINCLHVIIKNNLKATADGIICCRLTLRMTVTIEKGSEIYITYTHTLNPTLLRRDHLQQCKFFDCNCSRCADPTELGTDMGSMKCNKCDSGFIMSSNPLSEYTPSATRRQPLLDRHIEPKIC
jgi:hypothetical protein